MRLLLSTLLLLCLCVPGTEALAQTRMGRLNRNSWLDDPLGAEDFGSEDAAVSIPEPMVFDLVRPLGAHRGESEVNVLALFPHNRSSNSIEGATDWAPEVEFAVADGVAFEFEMPFEGSTLEAYKFAAQFTFGVLGERFIHGSQFIVEPDVDFDDWHLTALYLSGLQLNERWSALSMLGVERTLRKSERDSVSTLWNLSVFRDCTPRVSVGLENDFRFGDYQSADIIPQIHLEITDHAEVQLGTGARLLPGESVGFAGLRCIVSW